VARCGLRDPRLTLTADFHGVRTTGLEAAAGVAPSPATAAAGSPGITWIMAKVIRLTIRRIGSAPPNRRMMIPPMPPAQFANQTFDMRGMRNGTKPFTLDRTACTLVSEPNGTA
jgi:hypothetical protein